MKPLPTGYRFPGGPWIKIRMKTHEDIVVTIGEGQCGFWDHGNMTIWIDKSESRFKQWNTLWHELLFHAAIDLYDQAFGLQVDKRLKVGEE